MWQFIISAYIPGTNTQVNFDQLEFVCGLIACTYLVYLLSKERGYLQQMMPICTHGLCNFFMLDSGNVKIYSRQVWHSGRMSVSDMGCNQGIF